MNILILGPQGSGKGTQARLISRKYKLFYFESGEFSRRLTEENPTIKKIVGKGELIPQGIMTNYVSEYLDKKVPGRDNILFDGYPRFIKQYQFLEEWLEEKDKKIDMVFLLEIGKEETIKRLLLRKREDDYPEAIEKRLDEYHKNTDPMIEVMEKGGVLERVDGERPIEVIFQDIVGRIDAKYGKNVD